MGIISLFDIEIANWFAVIYSSNGNATTGVDREDGIPLREK